jgi:hypothetical protein
MQLSSLKSLHKWQNAYLSSWFILPRFNLKHRDIYWSNYKGWNLNQRKYFKDFAFVNDKRRLLKTFSVHLRSLYKTYLLLTFYLHFDTAVYEIWISSVTKISLSFYLGYQKESWILTWPQKIRTIMMHSKLVFVLYKFDL